MKVLGERPHSPGKSNEGKRNSVNLLGNANQAPLSPGAHTNNQRPISQPAQRLPRKGLMNENRLLGFLPPSRQSLPTRLPPPKENKPGPSDCKVGGQGWNARQAPGPPLDAPAFRTLESGRRALGTPFPLPARLVLLLATQSPLVAASRLRLQFSWQPPLLFFTNRLDCLSVLLEGAVWIGCIGFWIVTSLSVRGHGSSPSSKMRV